MRDLTITDLAKILQLDDALKEELKNKFDHYNESLKYKILDILWKSFHELKDELAKLKYEQFIVEVKEGKRQLMSNMYDEAVIAVWQDFENILEHNPNDLSQVRQDLYQQMKDKRDLKDEEEKKSFDKLTERLKILLSQDKAVSPKQS